MFLCIQADQLVAMNNNNNNKRDRDQFNNNNIIDLDEFEDSINDQIQPQVKKIKLDNEEETENLFERLPDEVLLIIYEYLDLESMYKFSNAMPELSTILNSNKFFLNARLRALEKISRFKDIPLIFLLIKHDDKALFQSFQGSYNEVTTRLSPRTFTPLCYAIYLKRADLVQIILDRGAYFNSNDSIVVWEAGDTDIIDSLINAGKDLICGLHYAVHSNNSDLVSFYLYDYCGISRIDEICDYPDYKNFYGETPLSIAITNNKIEMLEELIDDITSDNISKFIDVATDVSVSQAIVCGDKKMVELLVKHGFPVGNKDSREKTPLLRAWESNKTDVFMIICDAIKSKSANTLKFPIHYAAESGSRNLVEFVDNKFGYTADYDCVGKAPVHYAAQAGGQACIEYFLNKGVDINCKDKSNGKTLLHYAVELESSDLVKYLLECGADPLVPDASRKQPLEYALKATTSGKTSSLDEIIQSLVDYGAYVNADYRVKSRVTEYKKAEYNFANRTKILKEMVALEKNKPAKLPFLEVSDTIERRLNTSYWEKKPVNSKDSYGKSQLHYRAQLADGSGIDELLSKGASVNSEDYAKRTPLHYASWNLNGYSKVKALLEKGADPLQKDYWNKTALDYAKMLNNHFVIKLIEQYLQSQYQKNVQKNQQPQVVIPQVQTQKVVAQNTPLPKSNIIVQQDQNPLQQALVEAFKRSAISFQANNLINAQDFSGKTLLHYVVLLGRVSSIPALLAKNADPNISDKSGKTPLLYALEAQNQQILSLLLSYLATRGPQMPLENRKVNNYSDLETAAMWTNYPPLALKNYTEYKEDFTPATVMLLPQVKTQANVGIINESGSDCFINASLQVLSNLSAVQDIFMRHEYQSDSVVGKLITFFNNLRTSKNPVMGAKSLRNFITSIDDQTLKNMKHGQQDAQEFISALILNLGEDIQNIFKIDLVYTTLCNACHHTVSVNQPELLLSLPLKDQENATTVQELCTDFFSNKETVKQYACQTCNNSRNDAFRAIRIKNLPPVLVVAAKRFAYENNNAQRINTLILPQEVLMLEDEQGVKSYELKGIISHRGQLERGHYHAYVKQGEQWYRCDDAQVVLAADAKNTALRASDAPYIYFYQQVTQPDKGPLEPGL